VSTKKRGIPESTERGRLFFCKFFFIFFKTKFTPLDPVIF
jgi:hypothetical protein